MDKTYKSEYDFEQVEIPIKIDFDWKLAEYYQKAVKEVDAKLKNLPSKFTIAQLVRVFPKYERIILDVLESLRDNRVVQYVDYKPYPTVVEKI